MGDGRRACCWWRLRLRAPSGGFGAAVPPPTKWSGHAVLHLAQGRLVDGMLLDVCEMESTTARTLTMLVYSYRIGGVEYECSQDITLCATIVDPAEVRAGFPCSVRYQPGSPQNSIVVAEEWSGLREGLPDFRPLRPLYGARRQRQQRPQRS